MIVRAESGASFWTFILPQNKDLFPCCWWGLWMKSLWTDDICPCSKGCALCLRLSNHLKFQWEEGHTRPENQEIAMRMRGCEWQSWCWCSCNVGSDMWAPLGYNLNAPVFTFVVVTIPLPWDVMFFRQKEEKTWMKCSASKNHPEWDSSDFEKGSLVAS